FHRQAEFADVAEQGFMRRIDKLAAAFGDLPGEKAAQRPTASANSIVSVEQRRDDTVAPQFARTGETGQTCADDTDSYLRSTRLRRKHARKRVDDCSRSGNRCQSPSVGKKLAPAKTLLLLAGIVDLHSLAGGNL